MSWPNRANAATISITLTSLANASAALSSAQSAGTLDTDHLITLKSKGTTSADGYLNLYAISSDGGSSQAYATEVLNGIEMGIPIGSLYLYGTNAAQSQALSVAAAFGGSLPKSYKVRVVNNSGQTLSSTAGDHALSYERIYAS